MKRVIIFGGTGGIGQAICQTLAENGWSMYIHCNHNLEKAKQLCDSLIKQFPNQDFIPLKLDFLTNNEELSKVIKSLLPFNAAVFAQGITKYGFLSDQTMADIERIIAVNLTVPIKITKLMEPMLKKQDFSRVVYLGSIYGGQGSALETVYSATKSGLGRFSQAYAREVASTNLTVNTIAPGAVDTPMNSMFSRETMEEVQEEIPVGRLAKGEDISFWVKTLLDKNSGYCTGQTIYVTGGWLL